MACVPTTGEGSSPWLRPPADSPSGRVAFQRWHFLSVREDLRLGWPFPRSRQLVTG